MNSDFSLSGTIFDANNNWTGATSPAGLVSDSATHVAALQADGINMVRVLFDEAVVAANYDVSGQVQGVSALWACRRPLA